MKKPIIAIMYDFDKTPCTRDMQEYTFIPSIGMEPEEFAKIVCQCRDMGASIFGGCCGTEPRHIAALKANL